MSILYFVAGAVIGLAMIVWPGEAGYFVPVHVHLNLLGFMSMMIYGVGYHILPKFSGQQMYSPLIMKVQFWLSNAGLLGMSISWPLTFQQENAFWESLLLLSALLVLTSVVLFALNMLKTIKSV
jgi:drug/metabolite transporter (DMT)-like permease